ncbi:MAG: zinc-ribbon domain-containing protein [Deltaproteobacteria bacterium]|nr:zinc-ribbon domain-containing protein [Deltaproteobacteria bacterium]
MIVICEECGKKYQIDISKIKGDTAKSRCKACGQVITIRKPRMSETKTLETPAMPSSPNPGNGIPSEAQAPSPGKEAREVSEKGARRVRRSLRKGRIGLRGKMFVLFVCVPIILMAGAGLFYMKQIYALSDFITNEGTRAATQLAETVIAENARSVAKQTSLYLESHRDLKKENFNNNAEFKKIAVQKVGRTGYTALYELPGSDGVWRTWAHVNPKIIEIDMSKLAKPLGKAFPGFWRVYTGVRNGKESRGYYTWQDKDGRFRDKFMVCTPVEGTRFVIASTTYLDEFTMPMNILEQKAKDLTLRTRNMNMQILAGTLVLIGLIVSLYGQRLISRIKHLTEVTERISIGELSAEIEVKSKDELGMLAEAISRMQDSIRLSIERLKRRR